jgi:hypothetical protein
MFSNILLAVRDLCSPDHIPQGRRVTSTERPLAFSQQFAVNQIIETLGDSPGLSAVNGFPGTGKTTKLQDVIAAAIVNRAMALASLDSPRQALTSVPESWQTATASVDYFSTTTGPGNRALVAARLGNRDNRSAFARGFWFSDETSIRMVLKAPPPADWRGAVTAFRTALTRVTAMSSERTVVARAITRLPAAERDRTIAETAHADARELHKALILAEAPTFRRNLTAMANILAGNGRPGDKATLAAWQTLFLVVPVVPTTFASLDRLFTGLGREPPGWLLVDEAGQAPPQYAVGALRRARRAVPSRYGSAPRCGYTGAASGPCSTSATGSPTTD